MPAEQEIVHWYNQIPDLANGDIPDDYPYTPNDYPFDKFGELHSLLNRLCDEIGSVTYDISGGIVNIVARGLPNGATFSFNLQQWFTNEREVKRYLREWFPSFNIPYTMGGIANYISAATPTQEMLMEYAHRLPLNSLPNIVTKPIDTNTNPSTCTGKKEASDINYLDVI